MTVQRVADAPAQRIGIPGAGEEVEVEGAVQLVGAKVAGEALEVVEPHFADQRSGRIVGVGERPPGPVDVVDSSRST